VLVIGGRAVVATLIDQPDDGQPVPASAIVADAKAAADVRSIRARMSGFLGTA
jgi:hypothetical protein